MTSLSEVAQLRAPARGPEPVHVFPDRSGTGVELHVYADHVELQSVRTRDVRALWYRHVHAVVPSREDGREALAIVDRGGQVLVVPMAHDQVAQARWLISGLME